MGLEGHDIGHGVTKALATAKEGYDAANEAQAIGSDLASDYSADNKTSKKPKKSAKVAGPSSEFAWLKNTRWVRV